MFAMDADEIRHRWRWPNQVRVSITPKLQSLIGESRIILYPRVIMEAFGNGLPLVRHLPRWKISVGQERRVLKSGHGTTRGRTL